MRIIESSGYKKIKESAVVIDPETGEEVVVDDGSVDEWAEKNFGDDPLNLKSRLMGSPKGKFEKRRGPTLDQIRGPKEEVENPDGFDLARIREMINRKKKEKRLDDISL